MYSSVSESIVNVYSTRSLRPQKEFVDAIPIRLTRHP
jgi:hypothetical protein